MIPLLAMLNGMSKGPVPVDGQNRVSVVAAVAWCLCEMLYKNDPAPSD